MTGERVILLHIAAHKDLTRKEILDHATTTPPHRITHTQATDTLDDLIAGGLVLRYPTRKDPESHGLTQTGYDVLKEES